MPAKLSGRYAESLADPEILSAREEVALIDSMMAECFTRLPDGESAQRTARMKAAIDLYDNPKTAEDSLSSIITLRRLIYERVAENEIYDETLALIAARGRETDRERKRLLEMESVVTVERLMVQIAALTDVIRKHVRDRETLAAIAADLRGLIL